MDYETGLFPTHQPTLPPLNYDSFDLQWLYLEHRFQRFEQFRSVSTQTSPQESVNGDIDMFHLLPPLDVCDNFHYLDEHLLSLYEQVVFPDINMFQPLPPLDVCDNYHQADPLLQNADNSYSTMMIEKQNTPQHVDDFAADSNVNVASIRGSQIRANSWARTKKSEDLEFEHLQKYFDRPILEAAKELGIGLTLLKKRCRELGIKRWPHRKLRSLKSLINNVKELGMEMEVSMLEEQRKLLVEMPEMELNQRAKKIRQKSFKVNHMRKRKKKNGLCA